MFGKSDMAWKVDPGSRLILPVRQRDRQPTPELEQLADTLAKNMLTYLEFQYPGHPWEVKADPAQNLLLFKLKTLMAPTSWSVLYLHEIDTKHALEAVLFKAAGELLERFRLPRNANQETAYRAALEDSPHIMPNKRKEPE